MSNSHAAIAGSGVPGFQAELQGKKLYCKHTEIDALMIRDTRQHG